MLPSLRVQVSYAGHPTFGGVVVYPVHEGFADNPGAPFLCFGQIRLRGGRLRAGGASRATPATIHTSGPTVVVSGVDRRRWRERPGAELAGAAGEHLGVPAHPV